MSQEKSLKSLTSEKFREINTSNWPIDTLKTSCGQLGKQEFIQGLRENDNQTYYRQGSEVLENLIKIKELLNNTKINHHVFRKLHEWRVIEKHFLILLIINNDLEVERQRKISTNIVEILYLLTLPTDRLKYHGMTKEEIVQHKKADDTALVEYRRDNSMKYVFMITDVLQFFRNLLMISAFPKEKRSLYVYYNNYKIFDFIHELTKNERALKIWNLTIQELLFNIFQGLDPEDIMYDRQKESNEIAEQLLLKEQKKQKERQVADQKHQVKIWVQTTSGYEKVVSIHEAISGKIHKDKKSEPEGNIQLIPNVQSRWFYKKKFIADMSTSTRKFLKNFAIKFLNEAFNVLIQSIQNEISSNHRSYSHQYRMFYLVKFFLKLQELLFEEIKESKLKDSGNNDNRDKKVKRTLMINFSTSSATTLKVVDSILSYNGFCLLFDKMEQWNRIKKLDGLKLAIECLQQMARIVEIMSSSSDVNRETKAGVHDFEYCLLDSLNHFEFLIKLLENSEDKDNGYVKSLIEAIHRYLSMLEHFSKKDHIYNKNKNYKSLDEHEKINDNDTSMLQSENSNVSTILRSESSFISSLQPVIPGDTYQERNAKINYSRESIAGKSEWAMLYYQQGPPKEDPHFKSWWRKKKKYETKVSSQEYIKYEFTATEKTSLKRQFNKFEKTLANEKVLDAIFAYIKQYDVYEKFKCDFYAINVLFHRIYVNQDGSDLFIKVKHLEVMYAIELYWSWIIDNCQRANFKDVGYSESQLAFFDFIDEICNETCRRMNEVRVIPKTTDVVERHNLRWVYSTYARYLDKQQKEKFFAERKKESMNKEFYKTIETEERRQPYVKNVTKKAIKENLLYQIQWVQDIMTKVGRRRMELEDASCHHEEIEDVIPYDDFKIDPLTNEMKTLMEFPGTFDNCTNLLCPYLWAHKFVRKIGSEGVFWVIPKTISGQELLSWVEMINKYIDECKVKQNDNIIDYKKCPFEFNNSEEKKLNNAANEDSLDAEPSDAASLKRKNDNDSEIETKKSKNGST
ncbi:184_t:CDS:10 [Diversispora eburnea]|uniref:184_t:CDS:1 n=1 Tax=Diversispora eburnea TaxID=1213867 RepID=A0A9N9CFV0_9GLOM|nr:184_t:CDS:10 [Diversispora eburnea]